MTFELWDVEGKGKILLNLLKSSEPWAVQNTQTLQHMFKFLGARTRTQCVFEINRERVILRPSDWLLLTPKGWKKIATEEEIDNYVKRKLSGTLFVFEGIMRKDEHQIMIGTLYSPTRHECQSIELALQVGKKPSGKDTKDKANRDERDDRSAQRAAPLTRTSETTQHLAQPAHTPPTTLMKTRKCVVNMISKHVLILNAALGLLLLGTPSFSLFCQSISEKKAES